MPSERRCNLTYITSKRRPSALLLAALLCGSSIVGGCATPYLHDPAIETETAAVKDAYGALSNETYFKDLRAAFAALQAEEDAARTESLLADRDRQLTSAINPTDLDSFPTEGAVEKPEGYPTSTQQAVMRCIPEASKLPVPTRGPQVLCRRSLERLHALIGACPDRASLDPEQQRWSRDPRLRTREEQPAGMEMVCADRLGRMNLELWAELPDQIRAILGNVDLAEEDLTKSLKAFLEARDKWYAKLEKDKADKAPSTPADARRKKPGKSGETADRKEDERPGAKIKLACDDLLKYPAPLKSVPETAGLPDDLVAALEDVRTNCQTLHTAQAAMRPGGKFYRLITPMASGERIRIDPATGKVAPAGGGPLLLQLERKAARAREARAAATIRAAEVEAAIKRLQEQVKKRGATDWQIQARVKELKDALRDAPAAATLVGAEGLAEMLEDLLKAELQTAAAAAGTAPPAAAEEESATTTKVEAVLGAVSALQSLDNAIRLGDPNQRVSALLLAVAAERQKADMAALEQDQATAELKRLEAQELALATEASLLSETLVYAYGRGLLQAPRGITSMAAGDRRELATSALNRYSLSWSEGRIPYELLGLRETYLNREYRIRMAEKTASNWQALIQPAVTQLKAAGSGGIKPEIIAALLGRLGIGTALLED